MATAALIPGFGVLGTVAIGLVARLASARWRSYSLRGKNALVTGGSRGLGLEIARELVRRGANVGIVGRDGTTITRALDDLRSMRAGVVTRIVGEPCDLRDGAAIDRMIGTMRERLGPIDVLVNNAGMIQVGPLDSLGLEDFEDAMKLHYYAPLRTMLAVRAGMRARGGGRIANIASVGGLVAVPHLLPYSGSKFALVGLSEGIHAELVREGIRVSTICPGLMRTGSPRNATFKGDHRAEHAWFSVADSLPGLSLGSERAAKRIVRAIERGEARVTLGVPAKAAALARAIAPNVVARLMAITHQALPTGTSRTAHLGRESTSAIAPSLLTALSDRAALRNNKV